MALSEGIKDLYDEGRISTRQMVRFDFGGGTYGFISDRFPLTYNGLEYKPFGLIRVSDLDSSSGTQAGGNFTLTLAESPSDGLTPEILQQIEGEDYRDRRVTVYDAHFHPDTQALIQVEIVARGYLDVLEHNEDPDFGYVITANCEGRQLDYSRTNGRVRSMPDQKRRNANDLFFEHSSTSGRVEVLWGKAGAPRYNSTPTGVSRARM
jgi:hypothetical protein